MNKLNLYKDLGNINDDIINLLIKLNKSNNGICSEKCLELLHKSSKSITEAVLELHNTTSYPGQWNYDYEEDM